MYHAVFSQSLAFSFEGLLLASLVFNIPFAIQPMQRAFEALPGEIREAAWCSGMSRWRTFFSIEMPMVWTGILTAAVLTFAHTLGEFGVVLMVGGNIPGETKTIAPPRYILLHQRVRPSRGERENPVHGAIEELVVLGETASVTLAIDNRDDMPMSFNLPLHVVERNRLNAGDNVCVSLRGEGIHLMPPDPGDVEP
jgi:ABC-type sulfate transport system permease subunit